MASRTRPFVMTGAALVSAAAIVAATPALTPALMAGGAEAPAPPALKTAAVELTAITDITISGINDAYWYGWGGTVGCGALNEDDECSGDPEDPYFPGLSGWYASGVSGVLYYVLDETLYDIIPGFKANPEDYFTQHLYDYYFQVGAAYQDNPDNTGGYSGLAAAIYVGAYQYFGPVAGQLVGTLQNLPYLIGQAIVSAATTIVPTFDLGPIQLGGGILADLYFNQGGIPAILSYITTSITDALPTAAVAPAAAKEVTSAETLSEVTTTEAAVDSVAPEVETPAADTTPAATTPQPVKVAPKESIRSKLVDDISSLSKDLLTPPKAADTTVSETKTEEATSPSASTASEATGDNVGTTSDSGSAKSAGSAKKSGKHAKSDS